MFEIVLIVVVFGGILTAFLYRYLRNSKSNPLPTFSEAEVDEELAEKLLSLIASLEMLEKELSNLGSYVRQKVEKWKKKEKQATSG